MVTPLSSVNKQLSQMTSGSHVTLYAPYWERNQTMRATTRSWQQAIATWNSWETRDNAVVPDINHRHYPTRGGHVRHNVDVIHCGGAGGRHGCLHGGHVPVSCVSGTCSRHCSLWHLADMRPPVILSDHSLQQLAAGWNMADQRNSALSFTCRYLSRYLQTIITFRATLRNVDWKMF